MWKPEDKQQVSSRGNSIAFLHGKICCTDTNAHISMTSMFEHLFLLPSLSSLLPLAHHACAYIDMIGDCVM